MVIKQAILIQCHDNPDQINKLIDFMPFELFDFYIHIDKKSHIEKFIIEQENVFLCEDRVDVKWGRFSQVEATLSLFELLEEKYYSYVHLISGADFIIKSPENLYSFFQDKELLFIQCMKLPEESTWRRGGWDRYSVWYPQWLISRPSQKFLRVMRLVYREFIFYTKIFQRRNKPVDIFYGGSQWFSLPGKVVTWITSYLKEHPEYIKFFKNAIVSDEVFFSTLVMNSPYKSMVSQDHLRFMRWEGQTSGGPKVLGIDDIDDMISSDKVFARKFNDLSVIDELIEKLERTEV